MPQSLHTAFFQLGVRLGNELAARMLADPAPARSVPAAEDDHASRPPTTKPRILPGLSGRRRRPGEEAPRCGRPGCTKASRTRGYCQTHYVQWLKAGAERSVG